MKRTLAAVLALVLLLPLAPADARTRHRFVPHRHPAPHHTPAPKPVVHHTLFFTGVVHVHHSSPKPAAKPKPKRRSKPRARRRIWRLRGPWHR